MSKRRTKKFTVAPAPASTHLDEAKERLQRKQLQEREAKKLTFEEINTFATNFTQEHRRVAGELASLTIEQTCQAIKQYPYIKHAALINYDDGTTNFYLIPDLNQHFPDKTHTRMLAMIDGKSGKEIFGLDMDGRNFFGKDLSFLYMPYASFSSVNFNDAVLHGSVVSGGNFSGATCIGTTFNHATLENATFNQANVEGAHFVHAYMEHSQLTYACGAGVNFQYAMLGHVDFTGCNFQTADFSHTDLSETRWSRMEPGLIVMGNTLGSDFSYAKLRKAKANLVTMDQSIFDYAVLDEADFTGAFFRESRFSHASLKSTCLDGTNFVKAAAHSADFTGAKLIKSVINEADFTNATLSGARINQAQASQAIFAGAIMRNTGLVGTNCSQSNFSKADMQELIALRTDFSAANLSGADLRNAHLNQSNVANADFKGANLSGADVSGVDLSAAKDLTNTVLIGVKGVSEEQLEVLRKRGAITSPEQLIAKVKRKTVLSDSCLAGMDFSEVTVVSDMSRCNLTGTIFDQGHLIGSFHGANLTKAKLRSTYMQDTDLSETNLTDASLGLLPYMDGASLQGANLTKTLMPGAYLPNANLDNAILSGTVLSAMVNGRRAAATLTGASLKNAKIETVDFSKVMMDEVDFTGADFHNVRNFPEHLENVKGLETITINRKTLKECMTPEGGAELSPDDAALVDLLSQKYLKHTINHLQAAASANQSWSKQC